jgi:hypothetical protein
VVTLFSELEVVAVSEAPEPTATAPAASGVASGTSTLRRLGVVGFMVLSRCLAESSVTRRERTYGAAHHGPPTQRTRAPQNSVTARIAGLPHSSRTGGPRLDCRLQSRCGAGSRGSQKERAGGADWFRVRFDEFGRILGPRNVTATTRRTAPGG